MVKETFSGWIRLALALPLRGIVQTSLTTTRQEAVIFKLKYYRNSFDPCKSVLSVLSVVRFGFLCKANAQHWRYPAASDRGAALAAARITPAKNNVSAK